MDARVSGSRTNDRAVWNCFVRMAGGDLTFCFLACRTVTADVVVRCPRSRRAIKPSWSALTSPTKNQKTKAGVKHAANPMTAFGTRLLLHKSPPMQP